MMDLGNFDALNDQGGQQGNTHRLLEAIEQQKRAVEVELARLKESAHNQGGNPSGPSDGQYKQTEAP
jgi:hypothetical protein